MARFTPDNVVSLRPPQADEGPPFALENTLSGVAQALRELPEWRGVLATNLLDQRIVFREEPPFTIGESGRLAGSIVRDRDMDRIRHWFETAKGRALSKHHLADAVRMVADENAFHPVRDYLGGLEWDGRARLDRWLEDHAAVVPTSPEHAGLVRSVGRKWLISAVARAMQPGCKVDTVLIFEGRQGIGKSTALKTLASPAFYCDSAIDFASREACQTIVGTWIYELPELDALLRREPSTGKAFLSRTFDRFRVPYGRVPENVLRSVVFCGTVNDTGYLRDATGNRRFWIIRCDGPIDIPGLEVARDQLWAEARHRYEAGEPWHLSAQEEALMQVEHEGRLESDPLEEAVETWTHTRAGQEEGAAFTMNELLDAGLGLKGSAKSANLTRRVGSILARLGFERRKRSAVPRTYFYVCPSRMPARRPNGPVTGG